MATLQNTTIPNGGTLGSVDDPDAISISTGGVTTFSQNVDINGKELILDADGDTSITADTDDQIDIKVGDTDSVKIGNEHLTINDGNLVIGTAGHGIDFHNFGSGVSSNLLDDYEELTSTTIDFGNASYGSGGFSAKSKAYQHVTKIGNIVHVALRVTLTHYGYTNGSQILMRVLPYTPVTNASIHGVAALVSATGSGSAVAGYSSGVIYGSSDPSSDAWPITAWVKPSGTSGTSTWQISFTYNAA